MQCPSCKADRTYVTTTVNYTVNQILRYRKCNGCTHRFSTMEVMTDMLPRPAGAHAFDSHALPKLKPSLPKKDIALIEKIKADIQRKE